MRIFLRPREMAHSRRALQRHKSSIEDDESVNLSEEETRSERSVEQSDRSAESSAHTERSDRTAESSARSERSDGSSDTSTDDLQDAAANQGCLGKICGPCKRKKQDDDNEMQPGSKLAALKKLNCFKKQKKEGSTATLQSKASQMEKPGLCAKLSCCGRKDKVSQKSDSMDTEPKKGLAKICPCFSKNKEEKVKGSKAWSNKSMSTTSAPKKGFCGRLCEKLMCCRKKPTKEEDRRASIISKKPSIGPTVKTEDTGPKIDMSLVEHASMMRAAVPVLKVPMAWICLVFNVVVPGLGTIISGFLCLCFGHPRFSQSDNWRGRIGTFIINIIVGISQAFTIIFCLVGWGWSIWWGMMMVELAKKHKKLVQDAAMAENVEEGTISSNRTGAAPPVVAQNHGAR